jgi:hypothetical protein
MKIVRFGTPENGTSSALALAFLMFLITLGCYYSAIRIKEAHELVKSSGQSNITSTIFHLPCGLPYNDYYCSALSTKSNNASNICLNDIEIKMIHVLPLALFVLQLIIIYELFTLTEVCWRIYMYSFGIASAITFGVITFVFYHNSCISLYLILILCFTTPILLLLALLNKKIHTERLRLATDNN